jgi:hypothetical protein
MERWWGMSPSEMTQTLRPLSECEPERTSGIDQADDLFIMYLFIHLRVEDKSEM